MSSPGMIRSDTLQTLRGTRRDMSQSRWLLAIKKQPKSVQQEAACVRMDVEQAILTLGNSQLASIASDLAANEVDLRKGRDDLKKARRKLDDVKTVLGSVDKLLKTIGKIIKLTSIV